MTELRFDPQIHYQCLQCAKSCQRDWKVEVPESFGPSLSDHFPDYAQRLEGRYLRRGGGGCSFLQGHQCAIHRALGSSQKPLGCQQYPLILVQTPSELRVTASYTCTAVLGRLGPPLQAQADQVRQLLESGGEVDHLPRSPDWEEVLRFEDYVEGERSRQGWEATLRQLLGFFLAASLEKQTSYQASWVFLYEDPRVDLEATLPWVLSALVKPCLHPRSPLQWEELDRAWSQPGPIKLPEFDYQGFREELLQWATTPVPEEDLLDRYRDSLWFRKQHLLCHSLFAALFSFWAVGPLFRLLTRLAGADLAMERIELNLMRHTRAAERVFPQLCQLWVSLYRCL